MKLAVKKREGVHQKANSVHILKIKLRKGESWWRTKGIQARCWQLSNRAASFYLFVWIRFQFFSSYWSLRLTRQACSSHCNLDSRIFENRETAMLSTPDYAGLTWPSESITWCHKNAEPPLYFFLISSRTFDQFFI